MNVWTLSLLCLKEIFSCPAFEISTCLSPCSFISPGENAPLRPTWVITWATRGRTWTEQGSLWQSKLPCQYLQGISILICQAYHPCLGKNMDCEKRTEELQRTARKSGDTSSEKISSPPASEQPVPYRQLQGHLNFSARVCQHLQAWCLKAELNLRVSLFLSI